MTAPKLRGAEREEMKARLKMLYEDKKLSIAECADEVERSWSNTHTLLGEAGVTFRPRGAGSWTHANAARRKLKDNANEKRTTRGRE